MRVVVCSGYEVIKANKYAKMNKDLVSTIRNHRDFATQLHNMSNKAYIEACIHRGNRDKLRPVKDTM